MGIVGQIITVVSLIAAQSQGTVAYVKSLPPTPNQTALVCRDMAWEEANLAPVSETRLHSKLAPFVSSLLQSARSENVGMSVAVGYRNCEFQLQLRALNCGLGEFNLYQKPSNQCTPPTEPAGKSMHNEGLALDFTCDGYELFENSPCLTWLKQNAAKYHLFNHSIEAWHWSTTGI